ncbi:UDP-glucose/GDP-mannose dehydrogenase family protein [Taibaiella lutea]|uniref:UDP-glucose 6-dehydrogenase n=1 Tax=Taibaiella lutea TaxID=2608001 RepID=A0A5M6CF05_9BACT|nr:UDP-glucose/GDP-mannose dehydrogenase family protein [Taibaiella lutea]KAA5533754.1 UDP-glucose/GDP-mannose dehydrogenase family protein [Taibaiella lutea]
MKIIVVGTGYVGLVTGACLSDVGVEVVCVDVDQQKIENLNRGILPIYEPGLEEIVHRNAQKGRLTFTTSIKENIAETDAIFIAVGTPEGEDGSADLKYVIAVADEIGTYLEDYAVIITKSTVPVGSSLKVKEAIADSMKRNGKSIPFDVASNPEFLKEGAAISDFMSPDRIVVGVNSERAGKVIEQIYKPFLLNGYRMIFMDIPSAEMTKYAANAMLATRISFMNDIANLCEILGADINQVRNGIGSDPRIGNKFLYAGIGYGGACFPKDVKALMKTGADNGHPLRMLEVVEEVNNRQKLVLFHKLKNLMKGDLKDKKIAIWGLSFKPQTDDMREAPSILIINELIKEGAKVNAYDPVAIKEVHRYITVPVNYTDDEYTALEGADALLLLTEWREFRLPDWGKVKELMTNPLILDGRNIYNEKELESLGFEYHCIGVGKAMKI